MQDKGTLPEATTGRLEQKPGPYPISSSRPLKSHNPGKAQKRNPPQRGNVFPQKQFPPIWIPATNSLPVSDVTIQNDLLPFH